MEKIVLPGKYREPERELVVREFMNYLALHRDTVVMNHAFDRAEETGLGFNSEVC